MLSAGLCHPFLAAEAHPKVQVESDILLTIQLSRVFDTVRLW